MHIISKSFDSEMLKKSYWISRLIHKSDFFYLRLYFLAQKMSDTSMIYQWDFSHDMFTVI